MEIKSPTLVTIPDGCHLETKTKKFINDVKIRYGKPLILPPLKIEKIQSSHVYQMPKYTKLNVQEIYRLKDMASQLVPVREINQSFESHVTLPIVIGCVAAVIIWFLFKKRRTLFSTCNKNNSPNQSIEMEEIDNSQNRSTILRA